MLEYNSVRADSANHFEAQFCPVNIPYDDKLTWAALTRKLREYKDISFRVECFSLQEVENIKLCLSDEQKKRVHFTWLEFY